MRKIPRRISTTITAIVMMSHIATPPLRVRSAEQTNQVSKRDDADFYQQHDYG
jgi:hypothetical protein